MDPKIKVQAIPKFRANPDIQHAQRASVQRKPKSSGEQALGKAIGMVELLDPNGLVGNVLQEDMEKTGNRLKKKKAPAQWGEKKKSRYVLPQEKQQNNPVKSLKESPRNHYNQE